MTRDELRQAYEEVIMDWDASVMLSEARNLTDCLFACGATEAGGREPLVEELRGRAKELRQTYTADLLERAAAALTPSGDPAREPVAWRVTADNERTRLYLTHTAACRQAAEWILASIPDVRVTPLYTAPSHQQDAPGGQQDDSRRRNQGKNPQ